MKKSPVSLQWKLKKISITFAQKIRKNKILCYNLIWAVLLIGFCLYCREDFSDTSDQISKVMKFINQEDNDVEKLIKLSKINEGIQFEVPKFPYIKKYLVIPQSYRKNSRNQDYDLFINKDELFYSVNDTTYSNYSLLTNSTRRKTLSTPGKKTGISLLLSYPTDNAITFWRSYNSDLNTSNLEERFSYYSLNQSDSSWVRWYIEKTPISSGFARFDKKSIFTSNYYFNYNNSICNIAKVSRYKISQKEPIKQIVFKKSKLIGMTLSNRSIYFVTKSSSTELSLINVNPSRSLLRNGPDTSLVDSSDLVLKNIGSLYKKREFSIALKDVTIDNSQVAYAHLKNNKEFICLTSIIDNKCYVNLVSISQSNLSVVAQKDFPIDQVESFEYSKLDLITKGNTIWALFGGLPLYSINYKHAEMQGEAMTQAPKDAYSIAAFPTDNIYSDVDGNNNFPLWFSQDASYSIKQSEDNNISLIKSNTVIKVAKEDSIKLQLLKDFNFISYQNAIEPTFIGISHANRTVTKLTLHTSGKLDITIIDGINWDERPFQVKTSFDYYYIIILSALVVSMYFIGLTLIQNTKRRIIYVSDRVRLIPTLNEKIHGIRNIADNLKNKSNLMLILGILFGIGGIVAAYILVTMTSAKIGTNFDPKTILDILRPILLLVFIETFTFFFLKQYRVIFNEYKLFYSVYLKLFNYLYIIELSTEEARSELIEKLSEVLINEKYDLYETKATSAINEFDGAAMLKIMETMAKIKP